MLLWNARTSLQGGFSLVKKIKIFQAIECVSEVGEKISVGLVKISAGRVKISVGHVRTFWVIFGEN